MKKDYNEPLIEIFFVEGDVILNSVAVEWNDDWGDDWELSD